MHLAPGVTVMCTVRREGHRLGVDQYRQVICWLPEDHGELSCVQREEEVVALSALAQTSRDKSSKREYDKHEILTSPRNLFFVFLFVFLLVVRIVTTSTMTARE